MQINRNKINFMPLIRGPLWDLSNLPKHDYARTESLMFQFETDPEAIPPLLPDPFKPGKSPLVTVIFVDNNGVDFMAGGGYRLAVISVAAQFDGENGQMDGSYVLVMPENETLPIVTGREWLGMPKFFADISPIRRMEDGSLRCEASMWGHLLFGIELRPPFKTQNALVRKAAAMQATQNPGFGYKYISSLNGPPDADYPTVMWSDYTIDHLKLGKEGVFYLGSPTKQDIGEIQPAIEAISSLRILRITQAAYSRGSMVLRNDKNGRIK